MRSNCASSDTPSACRGEVHLLRGAKSQFRKDMSLKGLQKKAGWGENTLSAILMQEF